MAFPARDTGDGNKPRAADSEDLQRSVVTFISTAAVARGVPLPRYASAVSSLPPPASLRLRI